MSDPLIGHSALPTATDDLLGIMAERDQAVKERDEAIALLLRWHNSDPADLISWNLAGDVEALLRKHGRL